ncbi:MAG: hypothetical protein IJ664_09005, partial [Clostridia bacterium]|nr:hypothetical protein [Clostridia bacterium]
SEACLAEEFFIPIKFSARALLSAQENLQSEENDTSFSSGASTLSMPRAPQRRFFVSRET